jgi:hypothetical protein
MEMEGCHMSNEQFETDRPRFLSATEQAVAKALHETLPQHFVFESTPHAIEVALGTEQAFTYRPDFLIKDTESGKNFALDIKTEPGLSLANEVLFKFVSSAYKQRGEDFILLVLGSDIGKQSKSKRLEDEGIQTIWAAGYAQAAQSIEEFLTNRLRADEQAPGVRNR